MIDIDLKNPRVLSILDDFKNFVFSYPPNKPLDTGEYEDYTSQEYLDRVLSMGEDHIGTPDKAFSCPIKPAHYEGDDPEYNRRFTELNRSLMIELGLQFSALSQLYPPRGFIDWHNNANATGYNLLFTWSETGDGCFKYWDGKKVVVMQDAVGWNVKAGYFGDYADNRLVYHCAHTNCWRITLSYVLGYNEDYWSDVMQTLSEH